ncbi:alcohol dehydrogenase [Sulfodiicoccus acidiphilus]|uniref:Alcohol dehydrogenase n=1 Tax=Sulfodiicoccus acidiphilus TaxID=1670455 RepID=A0A348B621_9CREN|nr:NAD(P)-dependent alcohol dehydrogenase [Sulfodiicoccus acidiphilus]BBD73623.1 alcohol dehydrogenase [Sulfodiicoccus acidiphilus]GGU04693.1 alcohol dehydrogenase [Sulfodiicoccus acidiphilus]
MRAIQLMAYGRPLEIREVPTPTPRGEEVLVRVGGAGICHTDLHIAEGKIATLPTLPFTLGHEVAGYVERVGESVKGVSVGERVVVYGAWSERTDRHSIRGEGNLSDPSGWMGVGRPGGYAEFVLVPSYRYLVPLNADPVEAAPLADAGLTPYRAIKKMLSYLFPGTIAVVLGIGGLGSFALQYLRLFAPYSKLVAVDVKESRLRQARDLGADLTVDASVEDPVEAVMDLTGREGVNGVLDLVGTDSTMDQALRMAGRESIVVIVGQAGGTMKYSPRVASEIAVTFSSWGTLTELTEVVKLAEMGLVRSRIQRISFEEINDTFNKLRDGGVEGRAVLVP